MFRYARLEWLDRDKRSSIKGTLVHKKENEVLWMWSLEITFHQRSNNDILLITREPSERKGWEHLTSFYWLISCLIALVNLSWASYPYEKLAVLSIILLAAFTLANFLWKGCKTGRDSNSDYLPWLSWAMWHILVWSHLR